MWNDSKMMKISKNPPGGGETGAGLGTYPHTPLPYSAGAQKFKKYEK